MHQPAQLECWQELPELLCSACSGNYRYQSEAQAAKATKLEKCKIKTNILNLNEYYLLGWLLNNIATSLVIALP